MSTESATPTQGGEAAPATKQPISTAVTNLTKLDMGKGPAPAATKEAAPTADATPETDTSKPAVKVPKRLEGLTLEQVYERFSHLDSELGRKNNDIGQLRAVVDTFLRLRDTEAAPSKAAKPKAEPVTSDKLLNEPDATIRGVADATAKEAVKPAEDRIAQLEYELNRERFAKQFPDYQATMADENFLSWVSSSNLRKNLAAAAYNGSFDAATELFALYGEVQSAKATATNTAKPKKETSDISEATTQKPGAGGGTQAPAAARKAAEKSQLPVLRRGELMMLQIRNPDEYKRRLPEIEQAYRDKRVKD
jgi:hypothetical protein